MILLHGVVTNCSWQ